MYNIYLYIYDSVHRKGTKRQRPVGPGFSCAWAGLQLYMTEFNALRCSVWMVIIDGSANGHNIQEAKREESAQDFYIPCCWRCTFVILFRELIYSSLQAINFFFERERDWIDIVLESWKKAEVLPWKCHFFLFTAILQFAILTSEYII